ncbi:Sodium/hydrogen exchanger 8 [Lamellibrachia satsuma]|nr:Sodium/hydrogen exchanger 8 [Lamellibrachia satsuma]
MCIGAWREDGLVYVVGKKTGTRPGPALLPSTATVGKGLKPKSSGPDEGDSHNTYYDMLSYNISEMNMTMAVNTTTVPPTTTTTPQEVKEDLPEKGELEKEKNYSMTIFFILLVVACCILVTHFLIQTKFHYLPDSVAVVLLGALLGVLLKLLAHYNVANWQTEEHFPPTMFFLVLLPPIIFETGYNLHKGNFFQNIGTILLFAVLGTVISATIVGGGVYLLGLAKVVYPLSVAESFAFGSLISAVDPVATLAIFQAIDTDPVLYMLVFGESVLNDAVAIVLTNTVLAMYKGPMVHMNGAEAFFSAVGHFLFMFFMSSAIGVAFGLLSAVLLKFVDLRNTPSLEFGMMLVFSYAPYGLAEGLHLSGIMAILFCGIVMSHYTHLNLSAITQITVQQTFRTISFIAETCVFAYLGLAIFSFRHIVKPALVLWSIALILIARAFNIYPLSFAANYFREHKITKKMQFIMWLSGLRGAIAFALSLHLEFDNEQRHVIVTTTLIIVLFTVIILGGSTMPLMKFLKTDKHRKTRPGRMVTLSKTKEYGDALDSEHLSELTEEEFEVNVVKPHLKGFLKFDIKYLIPFFTRRFTQQEVHAGTAQMKNLTKQWYQEVRAAPSESDDDVVEYEL